MRKLVVALACSLTCAVVPRSAEACGCHLSPWGLAYPASGDAIPANGVLIVATGFEFTLEDSSGNPVATQSLASHTYSQCSSYSIEKPVQPLVPGETYTFTDWRTHTFTAGEPVEPLTGDVSITLSTTQHEAERVTFAACQSEADESTSSAIVTVRSSSARRLFVFGQARSTWPLADNEVFGARTGGLATPDSAELSDDDCDICKRLYFAEDAPEACARAWAYDETGSLIAETEECWDFTDPNDPAEPDDPADAGGTGDSAGASRVSGDDAGCSIGRAAPSRPAWLLAPLLFGAASLVRRRRRRGGATP